MKSNRKKFGASVVVILVGLMTIIGLSDIIFIIPNQNNQTDNQAKTMEESGFLNASDGKKISYQYFKSPDPKGWVVYLHMMPSTKESFFDLAVKLQTLGYEGISIDFRGHGQSEGGPDGYLNFSDSEHQNYYNDVLGTVDFLVSQGAKKEKIYFVGASIGANVALKYLSLNKETTKAVLLSPGFNYRGITTKDLVVNLSETKDILFVSSQDDESNSGEVEELFSLVPQSAKKDKVIFEKAGHGTDMFAVQSDLYEKIISFITN
ncbi:MAG: alpha/beta fold hydrolase [Candidatus Paceibacterota bacterium]|jgi:esterase/lipase